ncbi:MAG: IS5 family transposase [Paludibacteraceae bacterium]|nr:IS5 family transposase [Paludibacteraceae bacterium]
MNNYPTNLTDNQWKIIEKFVDVQARKRKYPLRSVFDAISYLLKSGCQWRMLPKDFPPYNTVFYYFSKWKNEGIFEDLFIKIHIYLRVLLGRCECPSLGLIDSRSVKTSHHVDKCRGIDGNKKIKGRKQHLVVDILGIPLTVVVHEANIHDSVGAVQVFENMRYKFPKLAKIIADGGFGGTFIKKTLKATLGCDLEIVLRPDECPSKFQVLPQRWIVERSFAWLENFRRLTIDYEFYSESSVAMIQLAFCFLILNKIFH